MLSSMPRCSLDSSMQTQRRVSRNLCEHRVPRHEDRVAIQRTLRDMAIRDRDDDALSRQLPTEIADSNPVIERCRMHGRIL